ncbi:serine hydrolase domain-containing protein [Acinetobacter variabilis]|uniref:serine hydrolase domain-containing protein n=1 Tax=Acinetobacter variabilis TaxID=70346 RepID=UPI00254D56F4|nr:serine hydrolase domain-containing protein [Acinetobacter variabilis]
MNVKILLLITLSTLCIVVFSKDYNNIHSRIGKIIQESEVKLSLKTINCSNDSPKWMKKSLEFIISDQKILTNQIAYIDSNQKLHTCLSGWKKGFIFRENLSNDTRFRYASLTKVITHHAILKLIKTGQINKDEFLVRYFKELNNENFLDKRVTTITIENLLEHRSGFDHTKSLDPIVQFNHRSWCPYNIKNLANIHLDFDPNQYYRYDNRNTCLLSLVLEKVTGESFQDYIRENYSLSAKNIKFISGPFEKDEVSYDYRNNTVWSNSYYKNLDFNTLAAVGGLSGNASQFATLTQELINSKAHDFFNRSYNAQKSCEFNSFKTCNGYLFRYYQKNHVSPKMYYRNGSLAAATSLLAVTENNEIVVWLGNSSLPQSDRQENRLELFLYKELYKLYL